jgi:hypothetical protein
MVAAQTKSEDKAEDEVEGSQPYSDGFFSPERRAKRRSIISSLRHGELPKDGM